MIFGASIMVAAVSAVLLFRTFFADMDDFWQCLWYRSHRGILAILFQDDYEESWWAQMKLHVYLGLSALFGIAAYFALHKVFGG